MTEPPASTPLDWDSIRNGLGARLPVLSNAMLLGLGAGLYFEYFNQPGLSPTHYFTGHNRRLAGDLAARASQIRDADMRPVIRAALRANALAMDLDRSNYTAIMGMELLAEDFENWEAAPDGPACAQYGARAIRQNGSLFRGLYLRFLQDAKAFEPDTLSLVPLLTEVAAEWDTLGQVLNGVAQQSPDCTFARAARVVRRVALLEEHFWGEIINRTE